MIRLFRSALVLLGSFSVITGLLYPAVVTVVAQGVFASKANGSLLSKGNQQVGSSLIGQHFDDPKYFWGRPSVTTPQPYHAGASTGSNLGIANTDLVKTITERAQQLVQADPLHRQNVPVDLVTASGSGLDPHISVTGAYYQIERVAQARNLPVSKIKELVDQNTQSRVLGIWGEPVVHVLALNLSLDKSGELGL